MKDKPVVILDEAYKLYVGKESEMKETLGLLESVNQPINEHKPCTLLELLNKVNA